jgi:hypothetical protein
MKRLLKKTPEKKGVKTLVKKPAPIKWKDTTAKALKKPDPPAKETKQLVRKEAEVKPVLPVQVRPVMPKGYKWKTLKVPDLLSDGTKLHRVEPKSMPEVFPRTHQKLLPHTVFRIDKETGKCVGMLTVMPDGVNVAWDMCGGCSQHVSMCTCRGGVVQGKGVEHIYITSLARQEGVDLGHPTDVTQHEFTKRGVYWYAPKTTQPAWSSEPGWKPKNSSGGGQAAKTLAKPSAGHAKPEKRLLSKSKKAGKSKGPVADVENLSMTKLNKDAKGHSESAVDELTKRLSKPSTPKPQKRLRKGK